MKAFGLDFSDASLKAIVFEKEGQYIRLVNFVDFKLEEGIIVKGRIVKKDNLAEAVKKALLGGEKGTIKRRYVVTCTPEVESFVRIISLPNMPKDKLKAAIGWEFEQHIPLSASEVYLDWQKVGERGEDIEVLVAASPKKCVEAYTEVLKNADLIPIAIEASPVATSRSLVLEDDPYCYLIVDIGYSSTILIIYDQKTVRFTSSVEPFSHTFTEQLAKDLKLNLKEAESLKRMYGLNRDGKGISRKIYTSLRPVIDKLAQEIAAALKFYNNHFPHGQTPKKIILCGGGAKLKGLVPELKLILKSDVILGDPWVNIFKPGRKYIPEISRKDSLGYATAIGLALKALHGIET